MPMPVKSQYYRPVAPKKAADLVFEQIRDLIYRGLLKPGDRLLPERELAESMGVSRPTVREAVSKLFHMGLIEPHQGQGTFVRTPSMDQRDNPLQALTEGEEIGAQTLLEVRLGLECNSAVLAARRATEEDIVLLEQSIGQMREQIARGGLGHLEDVYFHMRIAYATKNSLQIRFMKHFHDLLMSNIRENLERLYQDPKNKNLVHFQHEQIFLAIRNRDSQAAYLAMSRHIQFVMDYLQDLPPH